MGCCGCDNKTSASTAGILSIIQGGVGLVLAIHYAIKYNSEYERMKRGSLVFETADSAGIILTVLIISACIMVIWILASVALLYGNTTEKFSYARWWVPVTAILVLIFDNVVLPTVVILKTYWTLTDGTLWEESLRFPADGEVRRNSCLVEYIVMLSAFVPGGLVTFVTNIFLCMYTSRRVQEMLLPCNQVSIVMQTFQVPIIHQYWNGQVSPGSPEKQNSSSNQQNHFLAQSSANSETHLGSAPPKVSNPERF